MRVTAACSTISRPHHGSGRHLRHHTLLGSTRRSSVVLRVCVESASEGSCPAGSVIEGSQRVDQSQFNRSVMSLMSGLRCGVCLVHGVYSISVRYCTVAQSVTAGLLCSARCSQACPPRAAAGQRACLSMPPSCSGRARNGSHTVRDSTLSSTYHHTVRMLMRTMVCQWEPARLGAHPLPQITLRELPRLPMQRSTRASYAACACPLRLQLDSLCHGQQSHRNTARPCSASAPRSLLCDAQHQPRPTAQ